MILIALVGMIKAIGSHSPSVQKSYESRKAAEKVASERLIGSCPVCESAAGSILTAAATLTEKDDLAVTMEPRSERFPDNYVEKFPGLDTYKWLYGGAPTVRSRIVRAKVLPEADKYDHLLLVDLERGGWLFNLDRKFDEMMLATVKAKKATKYFFSNGRQIDSLEEREPLLPVCVLNVDLDRMPDMELNPLSHVNHNLNQSGLINEVAEITAEYPGYRGVRLTFATEFNGGAYQWLRSIECIVGLRKDQPDQFKQLELVHLCATVGTSYDYHDPEWALKAQGWKSFEELFPGHRLNEK